MPALSLDRPAWTVSEPFTTIAGFRELRNGAVLVSDLREQRVALVQPGGRGLRVVGRAGSGPGEYRTPTLLLPLPGDSTLLLDRDAGRYLVLDPAGGPVITTTFPPEAQHGAQFLGGTDREGHLYFTMSWLGEPDGPSTVAIRRWPRSGTRVDSVGFIHVPNPRPEAIPARNGTPAMIVRRPGAYAPSDAWAVAPSGRVAMLRAVPYRLDWRETDGRITQGAAVTYRPVSVTDADRKQFEPKGPPFVNTYPAVKPPFTQDVVIDPQDRVWVRRYGAMGAKERTWDVFGARGEHLGTHVLPANKRLLAITARFAYVIRVDDDDLQWLEAYAR